MEFSLDAPGKVQVNESFSVGVSADTTDDYDVKLFVHGGEYSDILSEIEKNGEWSNPYYYVKGVFPGQKAFTLRVLEGEGERELCGRLRKSGGSGFDQTCVNLTVFAGEGDPGDDSDEGDDGNGGEGTDSDENDSDEDGDSEERGEDLGEESELERRVEERGISGWVVQDEQIVFNPDSSSSGVSEAEVFVTSSERKRLWLIYGFTGLTLVVVLLLSLRKL